MRQEETKENIDKVIQDVASWTIDYPSTYYSREIDSRGYVPSRSAREILQELGLEI